MYVRTNKGEIFDCIESEQMGKPIYYPKNSKTNGYIDYNEVYKKANHIIDICEVGDYVNGTKVTMIAGTRYDDKDLHCYCDYCENKETRKWLMIPAKDIKSIVTKEQFSQMEYKVKE